jgi:DNA primase small subunit
MKEQSLNLVKRAFKEFYFTNNSIEAPARIEEREFGYMQFNGGMVRHLAFKTMNELQALLLKEIPSDVYCSCAYYASPASSMQEKGFRGADLIFDIDTKELNLACVKEHEVWLCNDCKNIMKERQNCTKCKSTKVEQTSLPCDNCVDAGKAEVKKLVKILREDLGVAEQEIKVYFSGNNGFHLHVYSKDLEELDSPSRVDIADYVIGNNLLPESFGVRKYASSSANDVINRFPSATDFGWRGRIAAKLIKNEKARPRVVRTIVKSGYAQFKTELNLIAKEVGARIDPKVTMDVHRVFRLQGSLNSKSGLAKASCRDIDNFDPFTDACVLGDEETSVHVIYSPKFKLRENVYGPFKDKDVKLPMFAAVYLICKGLADA